MSINQCALAQARLRFPPKQECIFFTTHSKSSRAPHAGFAKHSQEMEAAESSVSNHSSSYSISVLGKTTWSRIPYNAGMS